MLSVEEVLELQPGNADNATWINPGMRGVVRSITMKAKKTGGNFWPCMLGSETGAAEIEASYFSAPKFVEGDLIELSGQGLRRTEYQGRPQVALGKATETHVLGKSAHAPEQAERRAAGQPAVNGQAQPINGQTVGMAMKEAIALAGMATGDGITRQHLNDPLFWQDIKTYAGNIIRISRSLEAGKLSPPSWPTPKPQEAPAAPPDRSAAPARSPSRPAASPQSERQAANLTDGDAEDVPF